MNAAATPQRQSRIYVGRDPKCVLQYNSFRLAPDRSFGELQIHVVAVEPAIDIHRFCAGVPDCVSNDYMSRRLK
jgi:hypothetical protein